MKLRFIVIFSSLIVFFYVSPVLAALPKHNWQSGQITGWDKTILTGDLCYNWLMETVLFRQTDGRIRSFSANQVSQFGWFDFSTNTYRDFRVLSHQDSDNRSSPGFFEVCMDGPLTVVRQLKPLRGLQKHLFSHPAYFTDEPALSQNIDFFDYFVYDAGRLRAIDQFYTDVYEPLMTAYKTQLDHYPQVNNINDRTLLGRLVLIDRYNAMVQQDARTASAKGLVPSP
jgi:hypothetical protein